MGAITLDSESGEVVEVADSVRGGGIANPDGAGGPELMQAGRVTPARFQRVVDGIRDFEQELVWADHDNGTDANWNDAREHCAALGEGWALPSVAALRSLYDESGEHSVTVTVHGKMYTVKLVTPMISLSSLFLWSSEELGTSEAWYVDLVNGTAAADTVVSTFARAICVWRS